MKKIFLLSVISATAFFNLSALNSNVEVENSQPVYVPTAPPVVDEGTDDDNTVYVKVQKRAEYPGGIEALMKYLSTNIQYPKEAIADSAQGKVIVQFVIEKDGRVTDVEIVHSVHPALDKEALRVVKMMKGWIPATNNGKPVRCKFRLPVAFKM